MIPIEQLNSCYFIVVQQKQRGIETYYVEMVKLKDLSSVNLAIYRNRCFAFNIRIKSRQKSHLPKRSSLHIKTKTSENHKFRIIDRLLCLMWIDNVADCTNLNLNFAAKKVTSFWGRNRRLCAIMTEKFCYFMEFRELTSKLVKKWLNMYFWVEQNKYFPHWSYVIATL